jgi:hypothetical protein
MSDLYTDVDKTTQVLEDSITSILKTVDLTCGSIALNFTKARLAPWESTINGRTSIKTNPPAQSSRAL